VTEPRDPGAGDTGWSDPWAQWPQTQWPQPSVQPSAPGHQYPPDAAAGSPPPGYGYPPAHGYPYQWQYAAYRATASPSRRRQQLQFGLVAAALAGFGAAMVLIAFVGLDWYSFQGGQTVGDVRHVLDGTGQAANGLAVAYYSWFGWVLLVLCTTAAGIAALPIYAVSLTFRIAGSIVAGLAVLFTVGSVELTSSQLSAEDAVQTFYYEHVSAGFWVALIGFVFLGVASIVGPMRSNAE
jgi:hypothetical protein